MADGIINIYKEQGFTSFDVVAKLRGILRQKKIGHTGTLDPMAEGVLIICLGKATKLVDMMITDSKEYTATMKLGVATDTEDTSGAILSESDAWESLSDEEIKACVLGFVGHYEQLPPMYSAIKKDGKKLYEYARAGIEVKREKRPVDIMSIEDISVDKPYVSFRVKCSKGTYIRSLCRDIGDRLGCGAAMSALLRNELHGLMSEDAYKLSDIERLRDEDRLSECIIPMDVLLKDYKAYHIRPQAAKLLSNGNKLNLRSFTEAVEDIPAGEVVRVYDGDRLMALYEYKADEKLLVPYKMLL